MAKKIDLTPVQRKIHAESDKPKSPSKQENRRKKKLFAQAPEQLTWVEMCEVLQARLQELSKLLGNEQQRANREQYRRRDLEQSYRVLREENLALKQEIRDLKDQVPS